LPPAPPKDELSPGQVHVFSGPPVPPSASFPSSGVVGYETVVSIPIAPFAPAPAVSVTFVNFTSSALVTNAATLDPPPASAGTAVNDMPEMLTWLVLTISAIPFVGATVVNLLAGAQVPQSNPPTSCVADETVTFSG